MGMGGGGGGAIPDAGLSPMQRANWDIGKELMDGYGKNKGAMTDVRQQGLSLLDYSRGGLLNAGMRQVDEGLNAPSIAPGMIARNYQRYGLAMTPEQQHNLDQILPMSSAANKVAISNMARRGLADTQYRMRVGGITS